MKIMSDPVPAPTPVNWGWEDLGADDPAAVTTPWEYSAWVYWSNNEVTRRTVDVPRDLTEPTRVDGAKFRDAVWGAIHQLVRDGTTFRAPGATPPADPALPDPSGHLNMGPPEPPPPDPDLDSVLGDDTGADPEGAGWPGGR